MNKLKLIIVMMLWGSIGLFTRYISLSSIQLAFCRSVIALPILLTLVPNKKGLLKLDKKSVLLYAISGALIALAWVALFYGYKHTTIASAVIIYNMCPVYVMLLAPFVLKEKSSVTQSIVIGVAFLGLILIVGNSSENSGSMSGMIMSGVSGILYAIIVLMNRKMSVKLESNTATFIQMCAASLVLLPFIINQGLVENLVSLDMRALVLTIILGVVHTGIAYNLYFSTYHHMKSIDIVVFSYLEPVFGILLSLVILGESLSIAQWLGALLILGSTFVGEIFKQTNLKKQKLKA
ncbi:MAG: DMT family transporter [Pleomorphochaeta sp.]